MPAINQTELAALKLEDVQMAEKRGVKKGTGALQCLEVLQVCNPGFPEDQKGVEGYSHDGENPHQVHWK